MRILFVAMAASIHTARWINQIADQGWNIHLFPSLDAGIHPELKGVTVHDNIIRLTGLDKSVRQQGAWPWPLPKRELASRILKRLRRNERLSWLMNSRARRLARLIRKLKPDIIHSLEIQHAGYLTLDAKKQLDGSFPAWIVTNWGSDIYLFGRLPEHADKIRAVLAAADYYSCECQRDVKLGKEFGFKKEVLPVLPNSGGLDLKWAQKLRQPGPVSKRRLIMLKGYQSWAGRALVGLKALELGADMLKGYRVTVYSASPEVELAAELLSQNSGIPIDIVPESSHEEILRLHGRARISIGLSISDALSTSFIEALTMGSFPIQSNTSAADEWIEDGKTGLLVPPEDPHAIAAAIRHALTDDKMLDDAAEPNWQTALDKLEGKDISRQVTETYENILKR